MKWTVANEAQFPQAPLMGFYAAGEIGPQVEEGAEHAFLRGNAAMQANPNDNLGQGPSKWKVMLEDVGRVHDALSRNCLHRHVSRFDGC